MARNKRRPVTFWVETPKGPRAPGAYVSNVGMTVDSLPAYLQLDNVFDATFVLDGERVVLHRVCIRHPDDILHEGTALGKLPQDDPEQRLLWFDLSDISNDAREIFRAWLDARGLTADWLNRIDETLAPAAPGSTETTPASAEEEDMATNNRIPKTKPEVIGWRLLNTAHGRASNLEVRPMGGNLMVIITPTEADERPELHAPIELMFGDERVDAVPGNFRPPSTNLFSVVLLNLSDEEEAAVLGWYPMDDKFTLEAPPAEEGTDTSEVSTASGDAPWPQAGHTMFAEPDASRDAVRGSVGVVGPMVAAFATAFDSDDAQSLGLQSLAGEEGLLVGPARSPESSTAPGSLNGSARDNSVTAHDAHDMSRMSPPRPTLRPDSSPVIRRRPPRTRLPSPPSASRPALPGFSVPPQVPEDSRPGFDVASADDAVTQMEPDYDNLGFRLEPYQFGRNRIEPSMFVHSDASVVLGRSDDCDVTLPAHETLRSATSGRHAQITFRSGHFFIRDLHSSNGVKVNDEQIVADELCKLEDGDEITVGDYLIDFTIVPDVAMWEPKRFPVAIGYGGGLPDCQGEAAVIDGRVFVYTNAVIPSVPANFSMRIGRPYAGHLFNKGELAATEGDNGFFIRVADENFIDTFEHAVRESGGYRRFRYQTSTPAESIDGSVRGSSGAEEQGDNMSDNDTRQIPVGAEPRAPSSKIELDPNVKLLVWLPRILIAIVALLVWWLSDNLVTGLAVAVAGIFRKEILNAARQNEAVSNAFDAIADRTLRVGDGIREWTWPVVKWVGFYIPFALLVLWIGFGGISLLFSVEGAKNFRNISAEVVSSSASWIGDGVSSLSKAVYDKVAGPEKIEAEKPKKIEAQAAVDPKNLPIEEVPAKKAAAAAPANKPAKKVELPENPANPAQCFSNTATPAEKEACCDRLEVGDEFMKIINCKKAVK